MQRKFMFLFTIFALFSLILPSLGTVSAQGLLQPNHRIQNSAPAISDWVQSNTDGFGDNNNTQIWSISNFNGYIYAGTQNVNGAQIWRSPDGQNWNQFGPAWSASTDTVIVMLPFGSSLYVGTSNEAGGEIWRTDGLTWSQVVNGGFGDAHNYGINSFAVFSNSIYAATSNDNGTLQIYRSSTGNSSSWLPVVSDGFGSNGVGQDSAMYVYGSYLYVGLSRNGVGELWRTNDGTIWSSVFTNGLAANNTQVSAMTNFAGTLYIGLRNPTTGGEVWSSTNGLNFSPVFTGGLGNSNNTRPYGLIVFNGRLYLVFTNWVTGAEVWRTNNDNTWEQVSSSGLGDSLNLTADYFNKGATVFNNSLFIGTLKPTDGGSGAEVWRNTFTTFTDESSSDWAWSWVERLYAAGITTGCGTSPLIYCPNDSVTRAQMAVFLERGMRGSAYTPPVGTGIIFADVPLSYWADNWIEKLYLDGITNGCGTSPLMYCPDNSVTRAQMAVFLLRAEHGTLYTPPAAVGIFGDVPTDYWAAGWIEQLRAEGVTGGCSTSPLLYCPDDPVTRAQMAKFLVLTFDLP